MKTEHRYMCVMDLVSLRTDSLFIFAFFTLFYVCSLCLGWLGSVVVRASDSIASSTPDGALPGRLGQLSLPSLRGR